MINYVPSLPPGDKIIDKEGFKLFCGGCYISKLKTIYIYGLYPGWIHHLETIVHEELHKTLRNVGVYPSYHHEFIIPFLEEMFD